MKLNSLTMIVVLASLILQGCSSTRYFSPVRFPGYGSEKYKQDCSEQRNSNICKARRFAHERALEYRDKYTGVQTETSWIFDVPLIAIASGTAGSLLFGANLDAIKGLGLAGATWAGYKGYFYNKQNGEYFIKAEEVARCVVEASEPFERTDNKILIESALKPLRNDLNDARNLLSDPKFDSKSNEYIALVAAVDVAYSAIKMGESALNNIELAPEKVVDLVYSIDVKVNKFLSTNTADVSEIIRQVKESAKASVEEATQREKNEIQNKTVDTALRANTSELKVENLTPDKKAIVLMQKLKPGSVAIISNSQKFTDAASKMSLCISNL